MAFLPSFASLGLFLLQCASVLGSRDMLATPITGTCEPSNPTLTQFVSGASRADSAEKTLPTATNFEDFIKEMKASLDAHMLPDRAIHHLFSDNTDIKPFCDGDWMEFGVAYGSTINLMAAWRLANCGTCPHVHGFDTFTGLPEYWKRDDVSQYKPGAFDLEGTLPAVGPNVNLVRGLFNESLPRFLAQEAALGVAGAPLTFLHVDCDLYAGTADVFKLLAHKIVPGTVIVFDDLVNYQYYKDGEMKAWWEYLQASGAKFVTLGMLGPAPNKSYAMELSIEGAHDWFYQSAAFVITSVPGRALPYSSSKSSQVSTAAVRARQASRRRKQSSA